MHKNILPFYYSQSKILQMFTVQAITFSWLVQKLLPSHLLYCTMPTMQVKKQNWMYWHNHNSVKYCTCTCSCSSECSCNVAWIFRMNETGRHSSNSSAGVHECRILIICKRNETQIDYDHFNIEFSFCIASSFFWNPVTAWPTQNLWTHHLLLIQWNTHHRYSAHFHLSS